MSILKANLRHLCQYRIICFIYPLLGLMMFFGISLLMDNNKLSGLLYVLFASTTIYFVGLTVMIPIEILNKPFTYCLPGHREIPRKIIFIIGLLACFLFSLAFILSPRFDFWQLIPVILSSFFIFITFYWIEVGLIFLSIIAKAHLLPLLSFVLLIGFPIVFRKNLFYLMIQFPVIFISIGIFSSVLAWRWLGNDGIARRFCGKLLPSISGGSIKNNLKPLFAVGKDKDLRVNPKVEQFLLTHIYKCKNFGISRYIWGGLYTTFTSPLFKVKPLIFLSIFFIFFYGYIGLTSVFFMMGTMTIYMQLPLYSSMSITGGRRERFASTLAVVVVTAILNTVVCMILAICTIPMEYLMPEIQLGGGRDVLTFHAADLRFVFIPFFMIPITSVFNLIFYRKLTRIIFITIPLILIVFYLFIMPLTKSMTSIIEPTIEIVIFMIFVSWSLFLAILKYICERRTLVK